MPTASTSPTKIPHGSSSEPRDGVTSDAALMAVMGELCPRLAEIARSTHDVADLDAQVLSLIGQRLAAIEVRHFVDDGEHVWNDGTIRSEFWDRPARRLGVHTHLLGQPLLETYQLAGTSQRVTLVSAPFSPSARHPGCLVAVLESTTDEAKHALSALSLLATTVEHAFVDPETTTPDATRGDAPTSVSSSGVASPQALRALARFSSPTELAAAIVHQLKERTQADFVAMGQARGRRVRLLFVSGLDEIRRQAPGIRSLVQAMEECLDHEADLSYDPSSPEVEHRLLQQWSAEGGHQQVATLFLRDDAGHRFVVAIRRPRDLPFGPDELAELKERIEPYAGVIPVLERAARPIWLHLFASATGIFRATVLQRGLVRRVAVLAFAAAVTAFATAPQPFRLEMSGVVAPATEVHLSAPIDGLLESAEVRTGDLVREGDLLCTFDTRSLELERTEILAEIKRHEVNERRARAEGDRITIELSRVERQRLGYRLSRVEREIEQAKVRSPMTGVVLFSALDERTRDRFQRGEALFRMGGIDEWKVDLDVPELALGDIEPGLEGRFLPIARPDAPIRIRIDRIARAAEFAEGESSFESEASLLAPPGWLRGGMEGLAEVDLGTQPRWWIFREKVRRWFRTHL